MTDVSESAATDALRAIEHAFAPMQYPGDDNIVYDNSRHNLACASVWDKVSGLHWKDLRVEQIRDTGEDLLFMSPEGLRFFLPAYLRAVLLFPGRFFTLNSDLIQLLTCEPKSESRFLERFGPLSAEQKHAVFLFLTASSDRNASDFEDAVAAASASYWRAFP
jgi:hypothetical protein